MLAMQIDKPEFAVGSEKKFMDFINGISKKDKVAVISHTDLDGIGAAKIVNSVVKADFIKFVNYDEINDNLIKEIKSHKITRIIFTDLFIKDNSFVNKLEEFSNILIIDHHRYKDDINSSKTVFLNPGGNNLFCATYLAYYLFSQLKDINHLDWLVASACISDWAYFNNKNWMNKIFEEYDDKFEILGDEIRKSGKFWDLQWNLNLAIIYFKDDLVELHNRISDSLLNGLGDLEKPVLAVQKEINHNLDVFKKDKEDINGIILWVWKEVPKFQIGSVITTVLSATNKNKTLITLRPDEKYYHISARRQDKKEDMDLLMKKLTSGLPDADGGGHIPAAGGHILLKDLPEFKKRLKNL